MSVAIIIKHWCPLQLTPGMPKAHPTSYPYIELDLARLCLETCKEKCLYWRLVTLSFMDIEGVQQIVTTNCPLALDSSHFILDTDSLCPASDTYTVTEDLDKNWLQSSQNIECHQQNSASCCWIETDPCESCCQVIASWCGPDLRSQSGLRMCVTFYFHAAWDVMRWVKRVSSKWMMFLMSHFLGNIK